MKSAVTFDLKGNLKLPGFRPFLWKLAAEAELSGWAAESVDGVTLRLEGNDDDISEFIKRLPTVLPHVFNLTAIQLAQRTPVTKSSEGRPKPFKLIGPGSSADEVCADLAPCPDCVKKMLDPNSPYYRYPFTMCHKCGPRYSVAKLAPFSRETTAFAAFPPCSACAEKVKSGDVSAVCPNCGPSAFLMNRDGSMLDSKTPMESAGKAVAEGKILSVKTYDGFAVVCNALNRDAVKLIRTRKDMPMKPISLMFRDVGTVRKYCNCSDAEAHLLESPAAPVLIMTPRKNTGLIPELFCPGFPETVGVCLPYTAMLRLLFENRPENGNPHEKFDVFAFSGSPNPVNPQDAGGDDDFALTSASADCVLNHDLRIWHNGSASLMTVSPTGKFHTWRRSRGIAPTPVRLTRPLRRVTLALGSDEFSSVALGFRNVVAASHLLGEIRIDNDARFLERVAERMIMMYARVPEVIVCDMDIRNLSARRALSLSEKYNLPLATAQRHHANAIACMVEHGLSESLAVVFDGGAYGPDGSVWGAEVMEASCDSFRRLASYAPVPMQMPRERSGNPALILSRYVENAGIRFDERWLTRMNITPEEFQRWKNDASYTRTKKTHAALPLFDAVTALLGIAPARKTYDYETILLLESAVAAGADPQNAEKLVSFFAHTFGERDGLGIVDWNPLFHNVREDRRFEHESKSDLALAFLMSQANAASKMIEYAAGQSKLRSVVLSGKAFFSATFATLLTERLKKQGFEVLTHIRTTPDESSVSIGQAVFGGML